MLAFHNVRSTTASSADGAGVSGLSEEGRARRNAAGESEGDEGQGEELAHGSLCQQMPQAWAGWAVKAEPAATPPATDRARRARMSILRMSIPQEGFTPRCSAYAAENSVTFVTVRVWVQNSRIMRQNLALVDSMAWMVQKSGAKVGR